jgi:hypothetical protein
VARRERVLSGLDDVVRRVQCVDARLKFVLPSRTINQFLPKITLPPPSTESKTISPPPSSSSKSTTAAAAAKRARTGSPASTTALLEQLRTLMAARLEKEDADDRAHVMRQVTELKQLEARMRNDAARKHQRAEEDDAAVLEIVTADSVRVCDRVCMCDGAVVCSRSCDC